MNRKAIMKHRTNRRSFLKTTALGTIGWQILKNSNSVWSAEANEKLNLAVIGTGGRGRGHVGKVARTGHNLVAVCDVDESRMNQIQNLPAGTRKFRDFRKLFDELDRSLDGVIIAASDHNHAIITATALKRGKHVFCEKPLTQDIGEARFIRTLANEHKKQITQMGNQGITTDVYRRVLEQVQQGVIGEVREAHLWFDGIGGSGRVARPTETEAVPADFDWDLYLGPVSDRPYHSVYVDRYRAWREFTTGALGVCFTHSIHMTFRSLNLGALWDGGGDSKARIRVEAEFSELCPDNYPVWQTVRFDVPARGKLPPVRITCHNGEGKTLVERGIPEQMQKLAGRSLDWGSGWARTSGSLIMGSKGIVHTNPHNSKCVILPEEKFPDQGGPPRTIPASGSKPIVTDGEADTQVVREWTDAIKGGRGTFSDFNRAAPAVEFVLLGNIATRLGQPLEFDPVTGQITNHEAANQWIHPPRRKGWEL
jgi:hypothetical protein